MSTHTRKCNICGYTAEVTTLASEASTELGCINPKMKSCNGIMEIQWTDCLTNISHKAVPTRNTLRMK